MIDADTIDNLANPQQQLWVKQGLAQLYASGVIPIQIEKEKRRIIEGNADENIITVTNEVLRVRKVTQTLTELNQLAQSYFEELNNA